MSSLLHLVNSAAAERARHFAIGRPMVASQGFKEANIAHDMAWAFRSAGYYAFPEFHFESGSLDALFVRKSTVVVCEWKRLHPRSATAIAQQTKRMLRFDPNRELPLRDFQPRPWKIRHLWVCDAWEPASIDWWLKRPSRIRTPNPFGDWTTGRIPFASLGEDWFPYAWVWAIH